MAQKLVTSQFLSPKDNSKAMLYILHGLFGSRRNWQTIARGLSRLGHNCSTVDLRNHGDSFHSPKMDYTIMAHDMINLMNEHQTPSHVIGHSMGGKVAMMIALLKPQILKKLIVVDVSPCYVPVSDSNRSLADAMNSVEMPSADLSSYSARKIVDSALELQIPSLGVRNFLLTNLCRKGEKYGWAFNLPALVDSFEPLFGFPEIGDRKFIGPTLFVRGSRSKFITEESEKDICRIFPNVIFRTVEDAGHWIHSDKPNELSEIIDGFINK